MIRLKNFMYAKGASDYFKLITKSKINVFEIDEKPTKTTSQIDIHHS